MTYKKRFYLCLFGGWFGLHKFIEKDYKKGFLYLFTLGGLIFLWVRDTIALFPTEKRIDKWDKEKQYLDEQAAIKAERDLKGIAYCPKCNSTNLSYSERREMISIKRGIIGSIILAPIYGLIGLLTGKKYKRYMHCLKCGNEIELSK